MAEGVSPGLLDELGTPRTHHHAADLVLELVVHGERDGRLPTVAVRALEPRLRIPRASVSPSDRQQQQAPSRANLQVLEEEERHAALQVVVRHAQERHVVLHDVVEDVSAPGDDA